MFAFSECYLLANDLVLGYVPSPSDGMEQLLAGLMPFYDLIPQEAFPEELIRNTILFDSILPQMRSDTRFVDFPFAFEQRVGMPYRRVRPAPYAGILAAVHVL